MGTYAMALGVLKGYMGVVVTAPTSADRARLSLYDVTGRRLFDRTIGAFSAGSVLQVPVAVKPAVPVVVALTAGGRTYGRVIKAE